MEKINLDELKEKVRVSLDQDGFKDIDVEVSPLNDGNANVRLKGKNRSKEVFVSVDDAEDDLWPKIWQKIKENAVQLDREENQNNLTKI